MYLSAEDIAAMEGVKKIHFLNPSAVRMDKSLGDVVGLESLGVHLITVEPGYRSTEFHFHHYEEECTYVLSGHGTAVIGDERHPIGAGDFIGSPINDVAHELINDGDEPLVCLIIAQRLDQDVTDYPRLGKRLYRNDGEWNLVDHSSIEHIKR
ncbi:MAG: cupin domain-containing protein [Methylococcaceae bacterium]|nr:cupin domain-containing protein [Methylococcaceae bacterium]